MTFNTNNPLGSTDPRDLSDNAENLDRFTNGNESSYPDRISNPRKSWAGMESEFNADQAARDTAFNNFLSSSGYVGTGTGGAIEDYAAGIEITQYNQIIRESGEFYRAKASLSLPYTTTGTWVGDDETRFVSVGDAALRQELGSGILRANALSTLETTAGRFDGDAARLVSGTGRDGDFRWNASDLSSTLVLASVTSTSVDDTTDTITSAGHGLVDGNGVITQSAVNGLSAQTVYWVVGATTDTFQLSETFGGLAFDLTGTTNFTVDHLLDPLQGVYVTPSSDKTGASGAWKRFVNNELSPYWFGVNADSSSDDYEAWRACFLFVSNTRIVEPLAGSTPSFSVYRISGIFGESLTSRPLPIPSYLEADFSSVVFGRHPSWSEPPGTYLFDASSLYQADFGGIIFRDTEYCLNIENSNLNETKIKVSGVQFIGGDHSVRVEAQSAVVVIEDFKSSASTHFLLNEKCDKLILRDGWIFQGSLSSDEDATIDNKAHLIIENVIGVPSSHSGREVAWINNSSSVDISGMRFGGETGSCAAVNNYASADVTYPVFPNMVSLQESETYSIDTQGGTQESCVIRLFSLPNIVRFNNNRGAVDTQALFSWGSTANQSSEISKYKSSAGSYAFSFLGNQYRTVSRKIADENLLELILQEDEIALSATSSGVSGETITDTTIAPGNAGIFELLFSGNPRAGGATTYRSVWNGAINCYSGFNGSTIVKRLSATTVSEGAGGPSFASNFSVTPVFWDGATELSEVSVSDTTSTIRIKISGWESGQEGASFKGDLVDRTPV